MIGGSGMLCERDARGSLLGEAIAGESRAGTAFGGGGPSVALASGDGDCDTPIEIQTPRPPIPSPMPA